jgi:hypothetical protein
LAPSLLPQAGEQRYPDLLAHRDSGARPRPLSPRRTQPDGRAGTGHSALARQHPRPEHGCVKTEHGGLWAALVGSTMEDTKETLDRVTRGVGERRGQLSSLGRGRQARLTWWASRAIRQRLPHRHVPRPLVLWHTVPGGARRTEVLSAYCRCGARVTRRGDPRDP